MQDRVTPHTALSTRSFLTSKFGNRLIGKHFAVEWPPQSPELTPADLLPLADAKSPCVSFSGALPIAARFEASNHFPHEKNGTLES